jgi:hypothetical protein
VKTGDRRGQVADKEGTHRWNHKWYDENSHEGYGSQGKMVEKVQGVVEGREQKKTERRMIRETMFNS